VGIGPFDDATFSFSEDGAPTRLMTVVIGGACAGKTSLLGAIASTRPGHAVAQILGRSESGTPGHVVTEWFLGDDDPARPHALRVVSPNAKPEEDDEQALVRRREQALFDRRAVEGGFAFVALSGARWFSRTPAALASPDRTLLRYDARASASFDDASRADLTRETKQALTFAAIGAALSEQGAPVYASARDPRSLREGDGQQAGRLVRFQAAMVGAVGAALEGTGFSYDGVDAARLEPVFSERGGGQVLFDDLPRGARHAVAFAALPLRALCAAYPDRDPRMAEGLVLLDDAEAQLPLSQQRTLVPRLRRALPRVQWILTTASPAIAEGAEVGDVIALRRLPGSSKVELFDGAEAVLH
jgi:hypothetical protein